MRRFLPRQRQVSSREAVQTPPRSTDMINSAAQTGRLADA